MNQFAISFEVELPDGVHSEQVLSRLTPKLRAILHDLGGRLGRIDSGLVGSDDRAGYYRVHVYYRNDAGGLQYADTWEGLADSPAAARQWALEDVEDIRLEGWSTGEPEPIEAPSEPEEVPDEGSCDHEAWTQLQLRQAAVEARTAFILQLRDSTAGLTGLPLSRAEQEEAIRQYDREHPLPGDLVGGDA